MIQLLDRSKISLFDYLFVFSFVIYAGGATVFAREIGDIRSLGNGFALFLTSLFVFVRKIHFTKDYFLVIGVFLIYAFATAVVYSNLNLWWISVHLLRLTYAYVICKGFYCHLPRVFETVMYHLSIISLFFWIIMLVSPAALEAIVRTFEFSKTYAEDSNVVANMIIYTFPNFNYGIHDFNIMSRNPGFAWEAGAFASMISLAIFCNILRTNFVFFGNKSLWIFLLTLFSTQSTTGFVIFIAVLVFWLFIHRKIGLAFLGIPVAIVLFSLSFVGDKLLSEQQNIQYMDVTTASNAQGRLFSLIIDWEEFLRHPIIGLGCDYQNTWLNQQGYDVTPISGLGELLATYGAMIAVLFFLMLFKSSISFNRNFNSSNGWLLIVVIVGMMVSYALWKSPIYIAFWMFCMWGDGLCDS